MLNWFTNLNIGKKLTTAFLLVSIIPFAMLGAISIQSSSSALEQASFNELEAVRSIKKTQIEEYFQSTKSDLDVLRETLERALLSDKNNVAAFEPKYTADENDYYNIYIEKTGYYDLFLINPDGYIFYTAAKEADFQTNLINGTYSDSNLAKLFGEVMQTGEFGFVDFAPYAPSNGDPASFIAMPLKNTSGKTEMIVALQIPLDGINKVMSGRAGMGNTGESYLVGGDHLMRSDSYLDPVNNGVNSSFANAQLGRIDSKAVKAALAGDSGIQHLINYSGHRVISA